MPRLRASRRASRAVPKPPKGCPIDSHESGRSGEALYRGFGSAVDARGCLWMGGDWEIEDACGAPRSPGSVYCPDHHSRARRPG